MAKFTSCSAKIQPWSDYYWSVQWGGIAWPYASFEPSEDWASNSASTEKRAAEINSSSLDTASPAEKYDVLVGDPDMSLTKAALKEGKKYADQNNGKVERWMGKCHGWAPASYKQERPSHFTEVLATDEKTLVPFYQSDIKALSTLLWAEAAIKSKFIGGRCEKKDPEVDENGRIIDQKCFDTNPGTWHKAVVNELGVNGLSFVMDATFDYEVWNQPVFKYQFTYFNPQTDKEVVQLEDAMLRRSDFTNDKFSKSIYNFWRSPAL